MKGYKSETPQGTSVTIFFDPVEKEFHFEFLNEDGIETKFRMSQEAADITQCIINTHMDEHPEIFQ